MKGEGGEQCLYGGPASQRTLSTDSTHTHTYTHTHTQLCQPCHVHSLSDVFIAPSGETVVGTSSPACQPHYCRAHSPTTKVDLTTSPLASLVSLSAQFHPFVTPLPSLTVFLSPSPAFPFLPPPRPILPFIPHAGTPNSPLFLLFKGPF